MSLQVHPGVVCEHSSTLGVVVQERPVRRSSLLPNSGKMLLVLGCERSVLGTHRNSAAGGRPAIRGYRRSACPSAWSPIMAAVWRSEGRAPAEVVGARCTPPGQIPGPAARPASPLMRPGKRRTECALPRRRYCRRRSAGVRIEPRLCPCADGGGHTSRGPAGGAAELPSPDRHGPFHESKER